MTLIPFQVTFRNLARNKALEQEVRDRVSWLEQFYACIVRCHVLVEVPHRHRHDGRHFHVRIDVTVPGGPPIVVSHEPSLHSRSKDSEGEAHRTEVPVAFVEEKGEKGPQASTVRVLGKHHYVVP